jgi:hypothetical protein
MILPPPMPHRKVRVPDAPALPRILWALPTARLQSVPRDTRETIQAPTARLENA